MNDTNQMVYAPRELLEQALDAAASVGMQDVADELDRILTPIAEQYQSEPVWYMTENGLSATHAKMKALSDRQGWDTSDYSVPLYTHADTGDVERLVAANTEFSRRHLALLDEIQPLRAQLADLKRRHDGLHRDMLTIAAREVPKGCTVADYAAAIADALSPSAEPSATEYPRVEIVRAHKHTCASCKEGADYGPCDCGAIIDGAAVKVDASVPVERADPGRQVPLSRIREAMEFSAAGFRGAELQIGETHLRVSYHGIKWYHDRRHCNRWEPLAIEEFDELLCKALNQGGQP